MAASKAGPPTCCSTPPATAATSCRATWPKTNKATAINPAEATEEKVSLSDRFGLWLGFHTCDQATYLAMVQAYAQAWRLPATPETLRAEALEWSTTRGARSGRVAWQFIQDAAGRLGVAGAGG